MSPDEVYQWQGGNLTISGHSDSLRPPLAVADSWLVSEGNALALALHRTRFLAAVDAARTAATSGVPQQAAEFWDASLALIPPTGEWFPRVELRAGPSGSQLLFRQRPAPERTRSVVVATLPGDDPRTVPLVKGPDLERMGAARRRVGGSGAGEAILLTPEGYVVEGAYSGLLWWRGDILCGPPGAFDRVDSVTVRSVLGLAFALGVETYEEAVTPAELEGTELWSLNALHGIRIVTRWVDGPALAELPRRLGTWRARLDALRQPL